MSKIYDKDKLIAKVKADKRLTRQEEIFYMTNLLNLTRKEAEYIMNVTKLREKHPNVIFD
jgi:hypothetical protein